MGHEAVADCSGVEHVPKQVVLGVRHDCPVHRQRTLRHIRQIEHRGMCHDLLHQSEGVDLNDVDSQGWLQKGIMDALCPMDYWNIDDVPRYLELLEDFLDHSGGRHIYCGMETSYPDFEEIANQIWGTRALSGQGNTAWSYGGIDDNDYWDEYQSIVYSQQVSVPLLPWKTNPTTGFIMGHVLDGRGSCPPVPVEDAVVSLDGLPYDVLSSHDGFYAIAEVVEGDTHSLTVSKDSTVKQVADIQVEAGKVAVQDIVFSQSTGLPNLWKTY